MATNQNVTKIQRWIRDESGKLVSNPEAVRLYEVGNGSLGQALRSGGLTDDMKREDPYSNCEKGTFGRLLSLVKERNGPDKLLETQCPVPVAYLDKHTGEIISRMVPCHRLSCANPQCRETRIQEKISLFSWAFEQETHLYTAFIEPSDWKALKDWWINQGFSPNAVGIPLANGEIFVISNQSFFEDSASITAKSAKGALEAAMNDIAPKTKLKFMGEWSQKAIKEARQAKGKERKVARYMSLRMNNHISWSAGLEIMEACGVQIHRHKVPTESEQYIGDFPFYEDEQAVMNLKMCLKKGIMPQYGMRKAA